MTKATGATVHDLTPVYDLDSASGRRRASFASVRVAGPGPDKYQRR